MWKKLGIIQKDNRKTFRSHYSKAESPFKTLSVPHNALNDSIKSNKSNFCEEYMNRHYSADKHKQIKLLKDQSCHSIITISYQEKKQGKKANQDLFSMIRNQQLTKKVVQTNHSPLISDFHVGLMGQQLKIFKLKWGEVQKNIFDLRHDQLQLKEYLKKQIIKCHNDIKNTTVHIRKYYDRKKNCSRVDQALQKVKRYKDKQSNWASQKQNILKKHNIKLQNLI